MTAAKRLPENSSVAFMGDTKGGAFDISGAVARDWLQAPRNPNRRTNADVLRPWVNGLDVMRRNRDMWIIDFGWTMSEDDAALYEEPFAYALERIYPERATNRRESYARLWWRHVEPRPKLRTAQCAVSRYIVTPRVAKHRVFAWIDAVTVADSRIFAFIRDDDCFFGILHSRFHEEWSLRTCSWHGVGNDPTYNNETCFETFPFPEGLTPNIPATAYAQDARAIRIAQAAADLCEKRNAWLNPGELVDVVAEVVPGYPPRVVPKNAEAAAVLQSRTLTALYNAAPRWLRDLHGTLDRAVAAAYGWPEDISTDKALDRLLEMNLERASGTRDHRAA